MENSNNLIEKIFEVITKLFPFLPTHPPPCSAVMEKEDIWAYLVLHQKDWNSAALPTPAVIMTMIALSMGSICHTQFLILFIPHSNPVRMALL